MTFLSLIALALLAVALAAHFASIALTIFRTLHSRNATPRPPATPPVTILRPVCGLEHSVEETLASTFAIDWPDYEIIFCCASAADPVVPLVERLIAAHPHVPARLLTGDDRISINPKLNNLVKGWSAARHNWIVMADSNVLLPPDYLSALMARWIPGTGLVCSPPLGGDARNFGAELECAILNTYQARWQIAADTLGLGFAQGKTMLWRRETLDEAGGIRALAGEAAEDAAATKVVRRAGLNVRVVAEPYVQPLGMRSLLSVWKRQLRWARLRRVSFPAFFAPEILSGGFLPILAAVLLAMSGDISLGALTLIILSWYGAEALLATLAGWHLSARSPFAWVLRDLLLPALWVAAWTGNSFTWRGNAMDIGEGRQSTILPAALFSRLADWLDPLDWLENPRTMTAAMSRRLRKWVRSGD